MWNFIKQIFKSILMAIIDLGIILIIANFLQPKLIEYSIPQSTNSKVDHVVINSARPINDSFQQSDQLHLPKKVVKVKPKTKSTIKKKSQTKVRQLPKTTPIEQQALNKAQKFWIKNLGVDPFWQIPIYWHTNLTTNDDELQPLGVTHTLVGSFPLKSNHQLAYMQIDDKAAKKQHISLAQVLAHEWGHALGLKHGYGIMQPIASHMTWQISKAQRKQILQNYYAGH